jgi:predicted nucleotidyltransferase
LLELKSKTYRKNKNLFDIVLYGSNVKGKREANDWDIIFIFLNLPLKDRLNITQEFKEGLNLKNLDIKSINIGELFDKTFLARQGIFLEGISLLDKKPLREKLGFKSFELFVLKEKNLPNLKKVQLSYALNGRKKGEGFLKKIQGEKISQKTFIIPIENSSLFEDFLEKWDIDYSSKHFLTPNYK